MRLFRQARLAGFTLAAAILALGCRDATGGNASLRLRVSAAPRIVVAGDTVRSELVIRNDTDEEVLRTGSGCLFDLEVRRLSDHRVILPVNDICLQIALRLVVPARDERHVYSAWVVTSDVAPGDYIVRGVLNATEGRQTSDGETVTVSASR